MRTECLHQDDASVEMLKQLVANGDEQAFGKLFKYYAPRLTAFAYSITKNKDTSIEILDEVFVKLWKRKERLPQISNITVYLYTAIKNTALNFFSKKTWDNYIQPFDFIHIDISEEDRPDQQLISSEIYGKIRKAVEQLPPRCKIVFKLVREDGLRYKEVAEILGISEKTVDAQLANAVRRIGEAVGKHFDYFPARFQKK